MRFVNLFVEVSRVCGTAASVRLSGVESALEKRKVLLLFESESLLLASMALLYCKRLQAY